MLVSSFTHQISTTLICLIDLAPSDVEKCTHVESWKWNCLTDHCGVLFCVRTWDPGWHFKEVVQIHNSSCSVLSIFITCIPRSPKCNTQLAKYNPNGLMKLGEFSPDHDWSAYNINMFIDPLTKSFICEPFWHHILHLFTHPNKNGHYCIIFKLNNITE